MIHPYCVAAVVGRQALTALLEAGGDGGAYKDQHPWIVARELWLTAQARDEQVAVMLAVEEPGEPCEFSHWALVREIEVLELHSGAWSSQCHFTRPQPVNPIFTPLDSVLLKPSEEQLHREQVEPIRAHRTPLDDQSIRPYALCETPGFVMVE